MHQELRQLECGSFIKTMIEKLCILDIETTGFEPETSEILELYILKVADNEIIDDFIAYLNQIKK